MPKAQLAESVIRGKYTLHSFLTAPSRHLCGQAAAEAVGKAIGSLCLEKGIKEVVFDRGGFLSHGRVKAVAEGARESGLVF